MIFTLNLLIKNNLLYKLIKYIIYILKYNMYKCVYKPYIFISSTYLTYSYNYFQYMKKTRQKKCENNYYY